MINLGVNNGVYTMDIWICLDEAGPVFSWQGTVSGQAAFDKRVSRKKQVYVTHMTVVVTSSQKRGTLSHARSHDGHHDHTKHN